MTTTYKSISKVRKSYPNQPATNPFSLYIDDFDAILSNSGAETTLKNFLVSKKVDNPIFYMGSLLGDSGNRTAMRAFNTSLNTALVTKRSVNVTTDSAVDGSTSSKSKFNEDCTTSAQRFTAFSQEWEFWKSNPYGDFDTFKTNDLAIYNWCLANNVKYDIYVARCKDVAGVSTPEQVASWLVTYHDTIYLVDYVSTEKFNTYSGLSDGIKTQIQLFANAAKLAGKTQKMQILFASQGNVVSGVPTNMRTYFQANPTLTPAYTKFKNAYNAWSFTNKSNISFTGLNIYALEGVADL
jgi:hypothetical protein